MPASIGSGSVNAKKSRVQGTDSTSTKATARARTSSTRILVSGQATRTTTHQATTNSTIDAIVVATALLACWRDRATA